MTLWCHTLHELSESGSLSSVLSGGAVLSSAVWASDNPGTAPPYPGFDPKPILQELLSIDTHLKATCLNPWTLARAIEGISPTEIFRVAAFLGEEGTTAEHITDLLLSILYEDDYRRRVYFRLYNVTLKNSPLTIASLDGALQSVPDRDIPLLTGEVTPTSTLHRANTGNVFLAFEDHRSEDDLAWWRGLWDKANLLVRVLMYFKYEVVDIDYSVIHFSPNWVNQVRRYGISLWGQPRWDVQPTRYVLSGEEEQILLRYLRAMESYRALLEDMGSTLRQATATAGDYYEGHHARSAARDQLIALS